MRTNGSIITKLLTKLVDGGNGYTTYYNGNDTPHGIHNVIDLSVPVEPDDKRLEDAFEWAIKALIDKHFDKNDYRRADFEHIIDCLFYMDERQNFCRGNIQVLLCKYYDFWFTLWMESDNHPSLAKLVDKVKVAPALLLRFVKDESLAPDESIHDYLVNHSNEIAIFDQSMAGVYEYNQKYESNGGWILIAHSDYTGRGFFPISIVQSLTVLTATGIVWNTEKVYNAYEWCKKTNPVLYYSEDDMYTVTRYEPGLQQGRVNATPSAK